MARSSWYRTRLLPKFRVRSARLRRRVSAPRTFGRSSVWAEHKFGLRSEAVAVSFRSSYCRHHTEALRFFLDQLPHGVLELQEPRIAFETEIPRPWKRHVENVFYTARTCAHHNNTIGKVNGFIDLMCDEEHCLFRLAPDLQQLCLHELA